MYRQNIIYIQKRKRKRSRSTAKKMEWQPITDFMKLNIHTSNIAHRRRHRDECIFLSQQCDCSIFVLVSISFGNWNVEDWCLVWNIDYELWANENKKNNNEIMMETASVHKNWKPNKRINCVVNISLLLFLFTNFLNYSTIYYEMWMFIFECKLNFKKKSKKKNEFTFALNLKKVWDFDIFVKCHVFFFRWQPLFTIWIDQMTIVSSVNMFWIHSNSTIFLTHYSLMAKVSILFFVNRSNRKNRLWFKLKLSTTWKCKQPTAEIFIISIKSIQPLNRFVFIFTLNWVSHFQSNPRPMHRWA